MNEIHTNTDKIIVNSSEIVHNNELVLDANVKLETASAEMTSIT